MTSPQDPSLDQLLTDCDVAVIGGGLAGLAAAAFVAQSGRTATVIEARNKPGGRSATDEVSGYSFNRGPHALYLGGEAESVLRELGVAMAGGSPATSGGQITFDGVHHLAPTGATSLLRTRALGVRDKADLGRIMARLPKIERAALADKTVDQWIASVTVRDRVADVLHASIRLTTYCNLPGQLSADAAIGQLVAAMTHGVRYLDHGWAQLVHVLEQTPGICVVGSETVSELPDTPAVIIATGTPTSAARLLGTSFDVGDPALAHCLDLGLRAKPPADFVLGGDEAFYFSNHSAAASLAPTDRWHAAAVQYLDATSQPDPAALRNFVHRVGVRPEDIETERTLHKMTVISAIPAAKYGGLAGRPRVDAAESPNVFLAGDWVGPTGYLADASLSSARQAAHQAVAYLDQHVPARPVRQ